jgi:DNA-3-methyladenine glycosylase II
MTHTTFQLEAPAGFSLSAAAEFYAGFSPMGGAARRDADSLQLVFLLDGTFTPVSARLSPSPPAEERVGERRRALHLAVEGTTDELRVAIQISRMLGLDADAPAWLDLGKRDPLVGGLQRSFPGFFTAGFPSPYEAGVSGVLSHRSSVKQAASIRRALSKAHGTELDGVFALPTPRQLLAAKGFTSIPDAKWKVLQGLARAALDGLLDAERLRALPTEFALAQLQTLHGVGPWTAAHMLLRGATARDALPLSEPRVLRAFTHVSGRPEREFIQRAEAASPGLALKQPAGELTSPGSERGGEPSPARPRQRSPPSRVSLPTRERRNLALCGTTLVVAGRVARCVGVPTHLPHRIRPRRSRRRFGEVAGRCTGSLPLAARRRRCAGLPGGATGSTRRRTLRPVGRCALGARCLAEELGDVRLDVARHARAL